MSIKLGQVAALIWFALPKAERENEVPQAWLRLRFYELGLLTSGAFNAELTTAGWEAVATLAHRLLALRPKAPS